MADDTQKKRLILEGDSKNAVKAIDDVRKRYSTADKEFRRLNNTAIKGSKDAAKAIEQSAKELSDLTSEAQKAEKAFRDAAESKRKFGREQVGDISTSFGSIASVAGAGGGNIASEGLAFAGDLAGAAEYAGRFKDSINAAGAAMQNAGGVIGGLANAGASVASVIPGVSAGFGAVAAVAIPAAAGVVILATALDNYNKTLAAAQTELRGAIAAQDEYYALLNEGTTEDATARLDLAQTELENKRKQLAEVESARTTAFESEQKNRGDFAARILFGVGQVTNAFGDLDTKAQELKDAIAADEQTITRLSGAIDENAFAANDAKAATEAATEGEDKLSVEREKAIATLAQLETQEKSLNEAFKERQAQLAEDRDRSDEREGQDSAIRLAREKENLDRQLEEQQKQHEDNMLAIQERGAKAIEDARKALAEKEAASLKQIADLQADFAAQDTKARADFERERLRDEEAFQRDLKELRESFERSQQDAILENDVDAFLRNRRDFRDERGDLRGDQRRERGETSEDFEREREEARLALEARIADIQTELDSYRAATAAKIVEIQNQTATELALAQQAFDDKLAKDQALRDIENERDKFDADLREGRRIQDRQREDSRAQASHDAALARIDAQQAAETSAMAGVGAKVAEVRGAEISLLNGIAALARQAQLALTGASTTIGGGGYTGAGGSQIAKVPQYASGADLITRGGLAIVDPGERIQTAQARRDATRREGMRIEFKPTFQTVNFAGKQWIDTDQLNAALVEFEEDFVAVYGDARLG